MALCCGRRLYCTISVVSHVDRSGSAALDAHPSILYPALKPLFAVIARNELDVNISHYSWHHACLSTTSSGTASAPEDAFSLTIFNFTAT